MDHDIAQFVEQLPPGTRQYQTAIVKLVTGLLAQREQAAYIEGVDWGIRHMSEEKDWPLSWAAGFPGMTAQALTDRAAIRQGLRRQKGRR